MKTKGVLASISKTIKERRDEGISVRATHRVRAVLMLLAEANDTTENNYCWKILENFVADVEEGGELPPESKISSLTQQLKKKYDDKEAKRRKKTK